MKLTSKPVEAFDNPLAVVEMLADIFTTGDVRQSFSGKIATTVGDGVYAHHGTALSRDTLNSLCEVK